jgi:hypothetical protein
MCLCARPFQSPWQKENNEMPLLQPLKESGGMMLPPLKEAGEMTRFQPFRESTSLMLPPLKESGEMTLPQPSNMKSRPLSPEPYLSLATYPETERIGSSVSVIDDEDEQQQQLDLRVQGHQQLATPHHLHHAASMQRPAQQV